MNSMVGELHYRKLRAPAEDGQRLVDPPASQIGDLLSQNRETLAQAEYDFQGRSLAELRSQGRAELFSAALNATRAYRDVSSAIAASAAGPLLLAGHQPEVFHPGVWYKNFVLSDLAREHAGVGINLVIDSDTMRHAAIRVPAGSVDEPRIESVPFDDPAAEMPFEERRIVNHDCWKSFAGRVASEVGSLIPKPIVTDFWPLAVERARVTGNVALALSQARHQHEAKFGAETLELPQSDVCNLHSFHWFTAHLLANLPRLWEIYNSSVAEYRRVNRIRSTAHPVPDLAMVEDWLEAPFWIWSASEPKRRRLFVRQSGDELMLSDRGRLTVRLPLTPEAEPSAAIERLQGFAQQGIKLRTRALLTTMFARLVLSDLFLHGIGGSKYDQLTDALIERFFGIPAPGYVTVTATLRLPISLPPGTPADLLRLEAELRGLVYHPEIAVSNTGADGQAVEAVASKRRWVETQQTVENAKTRCRAIRAANESLQPLVESRRAEIVAERNRLQEIIRRKSLLGSREFSFVLYPIEQLQSLFEHPLS